MTPLFLAGNTNRWINFIPTSDGGSSWLSWTRYWMVGRAVLLRNNCACSIHNRFRNVYSKSTINVAVKHMNGQFKYLNVHNSTTPLNHQMLGNIMSVYSHAEYSPFFPFPLSNRRHILWDNPHSQQCLALWGKHWFLCIYVLFLA